MKKTSSKTPPSKHSLVSKNVTLFLKSSFWFLTGAILGIILFVGVVFFYFQHRYSTTLYPGVFIDGVDFGGKSKEDVQSYFDKKNEIFANSQFTFISDAGTATASAKKLNFGYDSHLLSAQSYSIGHTKNILTDIYHVFDAYLYGIKLPVAYRYSDDILTDLLTPITTSLKKEPQNALFTVENGKVLTFRPSIDGQEADLESLKKDLTSKTLTIVSSSHPLKLTMKVPVKIIHPKITTEKVNNLGIKELIAEGTSLYQGSIPGRAFNVSLASSRLNGILVPPGEVFSFNKAVGDVSSFTGYKQAYVIQNGRTVLGDGGGLCQVSTTLFRAALNAGLPIIERNAHAYRVHYYEEDSPPGIDATVFVPSVDFKFKNDTNHHILMLTTVDSVNYRLTFSLYGTKDGREVTLTQPIITSQSPAPEPEYQDDPTLPKGQVKQVDFAAAGANVYFKRTVTKDNKVIISETFNSRYRPWKAIFLRGTKEG